jgi:hypothetical protein
MSIRDFGERREPRDSNGCGIRENETPRRRGRGHPLARAVPVSVVPIVHCHHENWDGTGYPRGIAGADIPIGARILSVVDCFDALTSDRPYRGRMTEAAALEILRERSGYMYDPHVVATFVEVYRSIPIAPSDVVAGHEVRTPRRRRAGWRRRRPDRRDARTPSVLRP